jgi:hypothetical protein
MLPVKEELKSEVLATIDAWWTIDRIGEDVPKKGKVTM